jgi:uncharacterized delta-60 repeat protein
MERRVHTWLGVIGGVVLGAVATAHAAGGDIDPTFGVGGFVEHAIEIPRFVGDVYDPRFRPAFARDGGGRIGMAQSTIGGGAIEVRRFLPDGSADASFGAGGVAIAPIWGRFDSGAAVLVDATGGFIVRGSSTLVRFDSAGALVETFGNGGVVSARFGPNDSLLLPDGGVVDASVACGDYPFPLTLDRYLADGSLDPAFGLGGHTAPLAAGDCWAAIGRQSDGSLVVAANKANAGDASRLVRFFADGTRDLAFGVASGETPLEFVPGDLVVMADDRIVVASAPNGDEYRPSRLRIARFTAAGTPDTTFGIYGVSRNVLLFQTDRYPPRNRLLVADDGAATVFGVSSFYAGYYPGTVPYLMRFTPAGDVDTSFAPCGFAMPAGIAINDAALLPDGQVLLMGGLDSTYGVPDEARLRFARLGTPAPTSCLAAVPGAPRVGSKGFEKSFKASWRIDGDVAPSAFGDPLSTSGFALCVLPAPGASGDSYEARVFPGGTLCGYPSKPCWRSLSRGGYRFKTRLATRLALTLKPGLAGKAKLVVWEGGIADRTTPVTLRLDRVDGPECWEATVEQID